MSWKLKIFSGKHLCLCRFYRLCPFAIDDQWQRAAFFRESSELQTCFQCSIPLKKKESSVKCEWIGFGITFELMLTFLRAEHMAIAQCNERIGCFAAQLPLCRRQTRNSTANYRWRKTACDSEMRERERKKSTLKWWTALNSLIYLFFSCNLFFCHFILNYCHFFI